MTHFDYKQDEDGSWGVYEERDGDCVARYKLEEHASLDTTLFEDRMNNITNKEKDDKVIIFICMMVIMRKRGIEV